jgi:hemoglobin
MDDIHVPPGGPPQSGPSRDIYARMGQENIFRLCADFYGELEKTPVRAMFPPDMKEASKKLAAFLTGVLGGPPLYIQQFGHPRMRARHLPFAIDETARQAWLSAFKKVLTDAEARYSFPPEHLPDRISSGSWRSSRRGW